MQNVKLTLSLPDAIIVRAKHYAKRRGLSVSALVAHYLQSVTQRRSSEEFAISSIVKRITGLVKSRKAVPDRAVLEKALLERFK